MKRLLMIILMLCVCFTANAEAIKDAAGGSGGTTIHNNLTGLNDGDYQHLTAAEKIIALAGSLLTDFFAKDIKATNASFTGNVDIEGEVTVGVTDDISIIGDGAGNATIDTVKATFTNIVDAVLLTQNDVPVVTTDFRYSAGATSSLTHTNISALEFQVNAFTCNIFDNTMFTGIPTEYSLIQTTVTLSDNMVNYIVADYNSGSPIVDVETNPDNFNGSRVPVMLVYAGGGTTHEMHMDGFGLGLSNKLNRRFISTQTYARESGLAITMQGAVNTNFDVSAGKVWFGAQRLSLNAVDSTTDDIHLVSPAGAVTTITAFDDTNYFNGETLTAVGNNQYTVNWVYRGVEVDEEVYVMLGDDSYSITEAENAVAPSAPAIINSHAMLIGKVIFQKADPVPYSIQSAFDVVFAQSVATVHNDLSGLNVGDYQHLTAAEKAALVDATDISTAVEAHAEKNDTHGCTVIASQTYVDDAIALIPTAPDLFDAAFNTFVGDDTVIAVTTAYNNTIMGYKALEDLTSGYDNVSMGFKALSALTTGNSNVAIGANALLTTTSPSGNVAIGKDSMSQATYASSNVAIGQLALKKSGGSNNTAIGYATIGGGTGGGGNNVAIGRESLYGCNGSSNTGVGNFSLQSLTTGSYNTALGYQSLSSGSGGTYNVGIGYKSGSNEGIDNIGIGQEAGNSFTSTADGNVAIGKNTLTSTTYADKNIAVGVESLQYNVSGAYNIGIGYRALNSGTTGYNNIAMGYQSGQNYGNDNIAIGNSAGRGTSSTKKYNVSVGNECLKFATGEYNSAFGTYSLYSSSTGDGNTAMGKSALRGVTTSDDNTAIGALAGYGATTGYSDSTTDSNMTFLGAMACRDATIANTTVFTNSTAVGYNARVNKSNQVVLGTSATTETKVYGTLLIDDVDVLGDIASALDGIINP